MRVNLFFEEVQAQLDKLEAALAALSAEQPEVGAKFRTAVHQYFALHSQSQANYHHKEKGKSNG